MTNRTRGDDFERQTKDALRAYEWLVVRSAGSLGVADLVALRGGNTPLAGELQAGRADRPWRAHRSDRGR